MHFSCTSTAALLTALPAAFAQTFTDCDPTKKTCPNDTGLPSGSFVSDFTKGSSANASWSAAAYTTLEYSDLGANFEIAKKGQAPTIQTDFYIFFGKIDVKMRAAPGQGIVSSIVLQSDDLDEIDWEFLGGNTKQVETNFFGKGDTSSYDRATYNPVLTPQDTIHTYTIDWQKTHIDWIIDGTTIRTLPFDDASANGGKNFPQTPMRLKLGNWAGGAEGQPKGTVEWAGGPTDFSKGPFSMYVQSVEITNYNPASSYEFTDKSGSWQSVKIHGGDDSDSNDSSSGSGSSGSSNNSDTTTSSVPASTGSVAGTGAGSGVSGMTTSVASTKTSNHTTATMAPTSKASVVGIDQNNGSGAVVSVTSTGSYYSMNTASVSAQNTAPAGTAGSGASSTGGAFNGTFTGSPSSSSGIPEAGSGAGRTGVVAACGLLSLAAGFFML